MTLHNAPSAAELRESVRGLVPKMRERAFATEKAGRLADETIEELTDAGVFDMTKPLEFDGYEYTAREVNDVLTEIGKGCGSTAWVAATSAVGSFWAAVHSDATNEMVFANRTGPRANGVLTPRGTAKAVDGGYTLDGTWPFCTGCLHNEFTNLAALELDAQGNVVRPLLVTVPIAQLAIADDWKVTALRGSGSNSVSADKLFVEQDHALSMIDIATQRYACRRHGNRPRYRSAFTPYTAATSTGPALGLAYWALEYFLARADKRGIAYTHYQTQADAPVIHVDIGQAMAKLDAAQLVADEAVNTVDAKAESGEDWTLEERARVRLRVSYAVQLAKEAIDILYAASGGTAINETNPLQLIHRDITAMTLHGVLAPITNYEFYGRVRLGRDPQTPVI
jgi:alkylation response protein AidB-like acyl-CoA dehydrogenase